MEISGSIKDYKPTPEQIKSHQDHENKRREMCRQLELTHRDKWKQGKKK